MGFERGNRRSGLGSYEVVLKDALIKISKLLKCRNPHIFHPRVADQSGDDLI
jgi:hypothetical protein